jgi:hypothetical protein
VASLRLQLELQATDLKLGVLHLLAAPGLQHAAVPTCSCTAMGSNQAASMLPVHLTKCNKVLNTGNMLAA